MCEVMTDKKGFEIETCSRCGGSGKYSYCTMYGSRCFKCGGNRVVFTKRGSAAHAFYMALFEVPVESIKVGDWVKLSGYTRARVLEVNEGIQKGSSNGVPYELPTIAIVINTNLGRLSSTHFHGNTVTKCEANEVLAERLAKAMEYQASLTKVGKPRKVKVAK